MIGIKNVTNDPKRIDSPTKISPIPTYMGCLVRAKGPVVISILGISSGFTVVLYRLKKESVQRLRTIPHDINRMPKRLNGRLNKIKF